MRRLKCVRDKERVDSLSVMLSFEDDKLLESICPKLCSKHVCSTASEVL